MSLCLTLVHKPHILFHTFRIFPEPYIQSATCQLHRSDVCLSPGGGLQQFLLFLTITKNLAPKAKKNPTLLGSICNDAADRPATLHPAAGKVQICTLDVTWLLQNGQFIPAFKSLTGRGLRGDYVAAAGGRRSRNYLQHVRGRQHSASSQKEPGSHTRTLDSIFPAVSFLTDYTRNTTSVSTSVAEKMNQMPNS